MQRVIEEKGAGVTNYNEPGGSIGGRFSLADALRRVQELGAQLAGAARAMSEASMEAQPASMTQWNERAIELSTLWVAPMRAVLEEQQELIDAVSSWAEQQRKLADRFSELAKRHREMNEQTLSVLKPTLDHLDRMAGRKGKRKKTANSEAP